MNEYKLQYPVRTLADDELLPAGAVLDEETLQELSAAGNRSASQSVKLLTYGSIKKDLVDFFSLPPYDIIFANSHRFTPTLDVLGQVYLPLPILESLDHFKEYDFYTYRHMLLVLALSIRISQSLMKDPEDLLQGAVASPSHDFGKICVPLEILKKNTPLTSAERKILEHHTLAGYVLLRYYIHDPRQLAARVARDHHERMNGTGYPMGITAKDRMVEIVVVSDVYDALISPRPYRPTSYENRTALEEICDKAENGDISWDVVKALVSINRREKKDYNSCSVSDERRGVPPADNIYGIIADEEI
jgi:HD-GYP domain-containing protein (c-di-GMP phosphodiesterase class II)